MSRPGNPMPPGADTASAVARGGHGQPRPEVDDAPGPPAAAERARTLVEGNSSAIVVIPGLDGVEPYLMTPVERRVDPDGDVLLRFPADSPALRAARYAQYDELAAVLGITDVAPVAVPQRIRGRASVAGWLTPAPGGQDCGLLRLEVGEIAVDDLWGAELVEPEEFAAATPDPLAGYEAELLQHLAAAHPGQLAWLAGLLAVRSERRAAPGSAVPVALDRLGLRVRFAGEAGPFDARFEFPAPVRRIAELRGAMRGLFDAARESCGGACA